MDELSSRARALLVAAYGSDDPLAGDAARVRRGVLLRTGSLGLGATVFSLSLERAKALLGLSVPKLAAVVLVAVSSSAVYQRVQRRLAEDAAVSAPLAPVPRPMLAAPTPALASEPAPALSAAEAPSASVLAPPVPRHRRFLARPVSAPRTGDNLEGEMRWVRAADTALRAGNVGVAQGLLEEHAREFPHGALAEEREGLRVIAACQAGESAETKRAAAHFLERAPRSLLAGRVRAVCP